MLRVFLLSKVLYNACSPVRTAVHYLPNINPIPQKSRSSGREQRLTGNSGLPILRSRAEIRSLSLSKSKSKSESESESESELKETGCLSCELNPPPLAADPERFDRSGVKSAVETGVQVNFVRICIYYTFCSFSFA